MTGIENADVETLWQSQGVADITKRDGRLRLVVSLRIWKNQVCITLIDPSVPCVEEQNGISRLRALTYGVDLIEQLGRGARRSRIEQLEHDVLLGVVAVLDERGF